MNRRLLHITTLTVAAAALLPAGAAHGAKPLPAITKVEPLRLGIGDTLTISGKNFRTGNGANTVVFKRTGKRAIFAKSAASSSTELTVVLPEKLRTALSKKNGSLWPTKFQVNVLTQRFGKRYTAMAASPVIGPVATKALVDGGAPAQPLPAPVNASASGPAAAAPRPLVRRRPRRPTATATA
jgi:hypothetical protein